VFEGSCLFPASVLIPEEGFLTCGFHQPVFADITVGGHGTQFARFSAFSSEMLLFVVLGSWLKKGKRRRGWHVPGNFFPYPATPPLDFRWTH